MLDILVSQEGARRMTIRIVSAVLTCWAQLGVVRIHTLCSRVFWLIRPRQGRCPQTTPLGTYRQFPDKRES